MLSKFFSSKKDDETPSQSLTWITLNPATSCSQKISGKRSSRTGRYWTNSPANRKKSSGKPTRSPGRCANLSSTCGGSNTDTARMRRLPRSKKHLQTSAKTAAGTSTTGKIAENHRPLARKRRHRRGTTAYTLKSGVILVTNGEVIVAKIPADAYSWVEYIWSEDELEQRRRTLRAPPSSMRSCAGHDV